MSALFSPSQTWQLSALPRHIVRVINWGFFATCIVVSSADVASGQGYDAIFSCIGLLTCLNTSRLSWAVGQHTQHLCCCDGGQHLLWAMVMHGNCCESGPKCHSLGIGGEGCHNVN